MQFTYTTQVFKEGKTYVAYSPEIDLSSCGRTANQARQRLHQAIELFLDEAKRLGTLTDVLAEAGYRKSGLQWKAPEFIGIERNALAF